MEPRDILMSDDPLSDHTPCSYCRFPFHECGHGETGFEVDHIIPRHAAPHLIREPGNLAWACGRCNRKKSSAQVPFHPRRQNWEDHFLGDHNGKIFGVTETGHETSQRLSFNGEPTVLRLRARWFRNGWWPIRLPSGVPV